MKSIKFNISKRSLLICLLAFSSLASHALPKGFVYLRQIDPTIKQYMMYYRGDNFVGRRVEGYRAEQCILSYQAAKQLHKVQRDLQRQGLSLIVYDCYRPKKAVLDFISFAKTDDTSTQSQFYPRLSSKKQMFKQGYVAYHSNHSAGSTIDLAAIRTEDSRYYVGCAQRPDMAVDYGSGVDCMDKIANTRASGISAVAKRNRSRLVQAMSKHGFRNYSKEWWHYTLRNEPFARRQFNFDVY